MVIPIYAFHSYTPPIHTPYRGFGDCFWLTMKVLST